MAEVSKLPEPPDLTTKVFAEVADKAKLPLGSMIVLGVLAGVYVGLGGLFAIIALAGADGLPFGVAQVLAGVVFSLGLALVLIAGAELFTGNTLMTGPIYAKDLAMRAAARALLIVWLANLAGSLLLAVVVIGAGVHEAGEGAVGRAALDLGLTKVGKSFGTVIASGILANILVCLAVWMALGGQTVTQKFVGLLLPIAAFVAAGLEHSVANMYLLPYAYLVQMVTDVSAAQISFFGIVANLVPATIGNLIGGALVALAYAHVYAKR
ncbi:formate/nitrite transporter family protein [Roseinatronobacter sp. S2]|uniref:formate/nitrite transporter family protein n=1 Tax=Roseinatronobacter sp. S2 TaxID=3035471 RepID=UPI00240F216D|nr:formate/nitrite transporter family protein [Roseinatronobacter sp. S2]WFE76589.1 formate/nitrite transporter family protein [Roseinatronobacter sp. S2]